MRDLVPFEPLQFLKLAVATIAVIAALSTLVMLTIDPERDRFILRSLFHMFWMDSEQNVPTFVSFLLLGFGALLLGIRARLAYLERDRFRNHWALLGAIFVAMAFDEAAQIHEIAIGPVRYLLDLDGIFHFAWVVPALVLLMVLSLAYLPFLLGLPRATALAFIGCGAVFVGGAVGAEMIGGLIASRGAVTDMAYKVTVSVEETCEFLGLALFATTMLAVLRGPLRS